MKERKNERIEKLEGLKQFNKIYYILMYIFNRSHILAMFLTKILDSQNLFNEELATEMPLVVISLVLKPIMY